MRWARVPYWRLNADYVSGDGYVIKRDGYHRKLITPDGRILRAKTVARAKRLAAKDARKQSIQTTDAWGIGSVNQTHAESQS